MSLKDMHNVFEQLSHYRQQISGIHLAGGEPFLNFELLLESVILARKARIPPDYVETNAFWCIDDEVTQEKFRLLKDAGLPAILISCSPFHVEFIPFERTLRAVRIARQVLSPLSAL